MILFKVQLPVCPASVVVVPVVTAVVAVVVRGGCVVDASIDVFAAVVVAVDGVFVEVVDEGDMVEFASDTDAPSRKDTFI